MGTIGQFFKSAAKTAKGTHSTVGRVASFYARQGPAARNAIMGAGIGGLYGAFSDNTSVLGGMAMGASIGAMVPSARAGISAFRGSRTIPGGFARMGMGNRLIGAGRAAYNDAKYRASIGSMRIGATLNKAYGGFSAFAAGVRSGARG